MIKKMRYMYDHLSGSLWFLLIDRTCDSDFVSHAVLFVQPPPSKKQDRRWARTGSVASEVSDPEEYEKNLALLKVEQEKDKPSKRTIRQLMKSTYQGMWSQV